MLSGLIVLVCAVPFEGDLIAGAMKRKKDLSDWGTRRLRGSLSDRDLLLVISGAGKTNAAAATTLTLQRYAPSLVISFGLGGAYPQSGLRPGDIAVADKEIYGDEGVILSSGFRDLRFMNLPLVRKGRQVFYNSLPVSDTHLRRLSSALNKEEIFFRKGPFVTVSTVTGTDARAEQLRRRYRPVCENMEGAAVAHVSLIREVPFLEIRGISNPVGRRKKREWRLQDAAISVQDALIRIIDYL
jgi:futalosine hydrolase